MGNRAYSCTLLSGSSFSLHFKIAINIYNRELPFIFSEISSRLWI